VNPAIPHKGLNPYVATAARIAQKPGISTDTLNFNMHYRWIVIE
jgi:hypothetical protein